VTSTGGPRSSMSGALGRPSTGQAAPARHSIGHAPAAHGTSAASTGRALASLSTGRAARAAAAANVEAALSGGDGARASTDLNALSDTRMYESGRVADTLPTPSRIPRPGDSRAGRRL
jgi:hypothetical protein